MITHFWYASPAPHFTIEIGGRLPPLFIGCYSAGIPLIVIDGYQLIIKFIYYDILLYYYTLYLITNI